MSKSFICEVIEINDKEEAVVQLPNELINELDWKIEDELDYSLEGKTIIIKNLTKEKRNATNC